MWPTLIRVVVLFRRFDGRQLKNILILYQAISPSLAVELRQDAPRTFRRRYSVRKPRGTPDIVLLIDKWPTIKHLEIPYLMFNCLTTQLLKQCCYFSVCLFICLSIFRNCIAIVQKTNVVHRKLIEYKYC